MCLYLTSLLYFSFVYTTALHQHSYIYNMQFSYQWSIIKHLNASKLLNILVLKGTYWGMKIFKKAPIWGLPIGLTIEPTTACNLACPECPSGLKNFTRPTGKLDLIHHENWIQQLKSHVVYINYYFQGEPFLHPQFLDLIRLAHRNKVFTSTSSNGHFIDSQKAIEICESGLGQLILSIDGLTQETYSQYRQQGSLEKVLAATKHLVEAKKTKKGPHLVWQFLVVKPNEHEIENLFQKAKEYGIDEVRLKTAQLYAYENGNPLMPEQDKYSRYRLGKDGKYRLKHRIQNSCWRMWSGSVITWDGKIVPCCFDKDARHILGDLNSQNFKEIWRSEAYQSFRKTLFTGRDQIEICRNCTEGAQVFAD